jgi:hypothetical protein
MKAFGSPSMLLFNRSKKSGNISNRHCIIAQIGIMDIEESAKLHTKPTVKEFSNDQSSTPGY